MDGSLSLKLIFWSSIYIMSSSPNSSKWFKSITDNTVFLCTGNEDYTRINLWRNGKTAHEILLWIIVIAKISNGIDNIIRWGLLIPYPDLLFCVLGDVLKRTVLTFDYVFWVSPQNANLPYAIFSFRSSSIYIILAVVNTMIPRSPIPANIIPSFRVRY